MLWTLVALAACEITHRPFLFIGGKGGVGKSTTAAALATTMSRKRKLLLLSLDPSRPLSRLFERNFTDLPTCIGEPLPNLYVAEAIDPKSVVQEELRDLVKAYESTSLKKQVAVNEECIQYAEHVLSNIPGLDVILALNRTLENIATKEFETAIIDTEASGHTLRILHAPAALDDAIDKFNKYKSGIIEPIDNILSNRFVAAFLGDVKTGMDSFGDFLAKRLFLYKQRLAEILSMLQDDQRTRFSVVTTPDVMAVRETMRFLQQLQLNHIPLGELYVNQLFTFTFEDTELDELATKLDPTEAADVLDKRIHRAAKLIKLRRDIQKKALFELGNMKETEHAHIVAVPLVSSEIVGVDKIRKFGGLLQASPTKIMPNRDPDYFKHLPHDEL